MCVTFLDTGGVGSVGRFINTFFALRAVLGAALMSGAAQAASIDELDAWNAAQRLGSTEAYQAFLEKFPDSVFAEKAFSARADSFATAAGPADAGAASGAGGAGGSDSGASGGNDSSGGQY